MNSSALFLIFFLFQTQPVDRAKAADVYGKAEKRVSKTPERWTALAAGDLLAPESAVRTAEHAGILLLMPDKHAIRVGESTQLELKEVGQNRSYLFELITGEIWSFVNKALRPAKYEVETPSGVLGVSGTLFSVSQDSPTSDAEISVADGQVSLRQGAVTRPLAKGFQIRLRRNQLQQARPIPHDKTTQRMWKSIRSRESWTKAGKNPALNKDLETEIRNLRQERLKQAQAQQQQQQQQKKAQKRPVPQPKGKKPRA